MSIFKEALSFAEERTNGKPQSEARLCVFPHGFRVIFLDGLLLDWKDFPSSDNPSPKCDGPGTPSERRLVLVKK